jgi:uncharacterized protein (DUF58 family)
MNKFWNSIFLHGFFFVALSLVATGYALGHFFPLFYNMAHVVLSIVAGAFIFDLVLLYRKSGITAERKIGAILSNGDENEVALSIDSTYEYQTYAQVYDEIPYQLNMRELVFNTKLPAKKTKILNYTITPKERGEYDFGNIVILLHSPIHFVRRRFEIPAAKQVMVYPSYAKLNRYNLSGFKQFTHEIGVKKTRRIGHSTEFEQIKGYVEGDDVRHINWKASAKTNHLMVNQYTDEKAQQVYCIIDTGRAMQMPFDGLSLLDYAINASLALSHIIIKKHDRAGLIYFNKNVEKILPADKSMSQVPKILNLLYNLKTEFFESNFEKLYAKLRFKVTHRSLMLLFTNFEDMNALKRQLPYLKSIARNNVLLVIFFKNSEIENVIKAPALHQKEYYHKAVSEKLSYQKKLMALELQRHGIQTLVTAPQSLTTDAISKYLEIKAKAII